VRECPDGCLLGIALSSDRTTPIKPGAKPRRERSRDGQAMGAALRSIYQKTVDEAVPPEMLDLLGKLD